ncbi:hypothetical protein EMPS_09598 [Entomortierella parvispora]|uniref:Cytochrome P450 n=1 Tax=Entomortierella parvispora TaxID=205924 RepID=A0A9P3HIA7_9FUNG|nr:hypothetical protein EMPS_09598 [Entomortierella parvispora]
MIYNAFFHPLAPIPGNKLVASTYISTGISSLTGRSHYGLPLFHKFYGKVVRIGPEFVSVADKDMIREILVTTDYPKSVVHEGFELNEQHNLFSSRNKDFHKNRRRLIAPAFGLQYLRTLEPIMHECIHILLKKIDQVLEDPTTVKKGAKVLPKGQINVCSFMMRLSLDIIGETAFGQSFDMVLDDSHPVPGIMAKTLKRCMQQTFNPWMKYIVPLDFSFVDFGAKRVQDRKAKGEKGRRADLLQYLIDAQVREQKLIKLREELDLATASNAPGLLPSYNQVRNLQYLTGCISESLRLRPVAATGLPREVTEDVTMNGYFFPKGTVLFAQLPQLHWSDEYFPQAKKFIPERWIPGLSPFPPVQDFTFYPFSAGTRNCVGKNFAMMEMRLILATLVLNYDIKAVPGQRQDYVQYITTALATESYIIKMKRRVGKRKE